MGEGSGLSSHRTLLYLAAALVLVEGRLFAGQKSQAVGIDSTCAATRNGFREAAPFYFAGPEPWVELDHPPSTLVDGALATVYASGPRIRLLVLQVTREASHPWFESTEYCFDGSGALLRQSRRLEHEEANIVIEDTKYFSRYKPFKSSYKHHSLHPGVEDWDKFSDPGTPDYLDVSDLPFALPQDGLADVARAYSGEDALLVQALGSRGSVSESE
jgi:hypothetical protein